MRALQLFRMSEGSLLADYSSMMSEQLLRRRADLEVRAARAAAENAIKARSEFLANMNHELRTPLNAIIGFATMLRQTEDFAIDAERTNEYAQYILQSADLLLGHINTILEVAAFESGSIELSNRKVDLDAMLTEAVERAKIRADAAGVSIIRKGDGKPVLAWGDAVRISQSIDHILHTATRASGEGGRILVRAAYDDAGRPEIAVRDEGEGLSENEIKQALTAFNEVHRGLDRAFSGPGVGYAIAKTFIEMQDGRFAIKSRKGRGTFVSLTLPAPETVSDEAEDEKIGADDPYILETSHAA